MDGVDLGVGVFDDRAELKTQDVSYSKAATALVFLRYSLLCRYVVSFPSSEIQMCCRSIPTTLTALARPPNLS